MTAHNFSQVIGRFASKFCVRRKKQGFYSGGIWQEPKDDKFHVTGSVQVARGHDLQDVSEARRVSAARKIYTTERLHTVETSELSQPDIIEWDGCLWQVETVDRWPHLGNYYKVIALKVDNP
jgi:uncharacterized protein (DUF885 family)